MSSADVQVPDGIGRRTAHGALLNLGLQLLLKGGTLATTVVLARTLTPSEFGVVALALVVISYLETVNNFGLASAVVREDGDQRWLSTAFWLSLTTGALAFALSAGLAPWLATAYGEPQLAGVLTALGLSFLVVSAATIHDARMRRQLLWRRRVPAEASRGAVKATVAITLALAGAGVWSLVVGQLAGAAAWTAAVLLLHRWRPSATFDVGAARSQLRYGGQVSLTTGSAAVLKDVDYVIVGFVLTAADLGYYNLGFRLPDLAVMSLAWALSATTFPAFALVRDQPERLQRAVLRVQRISALLLLPVSAVLAAGSDDLVGLLFGEKWAPTAAVMPLIAGYAVLHALAFVGGDAIKAVGRMGLVSAVALVRLPVTVVALLLACPHGILAVAVTQLALMAINIVVQALLCRRVLGIGLRTFFGGLLPAAVCSAVLAVVVWSVGGIGLPAGVSLATGLVVGGLAWLAAALWLDRSTLADVVGLASSRIPVLVPVSRRLAS